MGKQNVPMNSDNKGKSNSNMTEEKTPIYSGNMYEYDGAYYDKQFPLEWAKSHLPGTGPKECLNCNDYGIWLGVFVGYCANCAADYGFARTSGFLARGVPNPVESIPTPFDEYLLGVSLGEIGKPCLPPPTPLRRLRNPDYYKIREEEKQESYADYFDKIIPQTTFAEEPDHDDCSECNKNTAFVANDSEAWRRENLPAGTYYRRRDPSGNHADWLSHVNEFLLSENQQLKRALNNETVRMGHYKRLWKADHDQINYLMELISTLEAELDLKG